MGKKEKEIFKIGDWVKIKIIGLYMEEDVSHYRIKEINGDECVCVSQEGTYEHKITVIKDKLVKLWKC